MTRRLLWGFGGIWLAMLAGHVVTGFDDLLLFEWIYAPFSLSLHGLRAGKVWQVITYPFLHSLAHLSDILFSLLTLYFFGSSIERERGRRALLELLVVGIVAGALSFVVAELLARWLFGTDGAMLRGIGAGTAALIGATCWLWRRRSLNLILFSLTGKQLLVALVVLQVLMGLTSAGTLALAQLGGIGGGVLWAMLQTGTPGDLSPRRLWVRLRLWWARRKLRVLDGGKPRDFQRPTHHRAPACLASLGHTPQK